MNGYNNEFAFVLAVNNKKVSELNPLLFDLIIAIFKNENISEDSLIKSWKNHYKQKTDVFIKINNVSKRVSIKVGNRNSIHVESIDTFVNFLEKENISSNIIEKYLKYHYGDGTIDNSGIKRIDSITYKNFNKSDIVEINNEFSNNSLLLKVIGHSYTIRRY